MHPAAIWASAGKIACQYIGNPYVAGGTSLTMVQTAPDLPSGYTVTSATVFPVLPMSREAAVPVWINSSAQPGDLICYDGHVAMYIGGGLIVHASTQRTGIKVSNANYRPILAVRRVV